MTPRIVYVDSPFDHGEAVEELAPAGFELVRAKAGSPAYREALGEASYLVGFVDGLVEEGLYRAAPKLKLIQLLSAGYDRADVAAARRAGVPIANNGGANAVAVAEHALMLMLAVCRRLPLQHANVGSGRWRGNEAPRVHELRGRTLGIVGLGTIGKKTARLARAFGMVCSTTTSPGSPRTPRTPSASASACWERSSAAPTSYRCTCPSTPRPAA